MTRRRWIADEVKGDSAAVIGEHAFHLARVLRARPGQQFEVSADGQVRLATVHQVADDRVEFTLGEHRAQSAAVAIHLYLSIFKFDRMEWAIEKATELGVAEVIPLIARRTDVHLAAAAGKRLQRWRKIALAASEQSRGAAPPLIRDPAPLGPFLQDVCSSMLAVVLAETSGCSPLLEVLDHSSGGAGIALAIGPEGGWAPEELALFEQMQWTPASLGPTILRTETAAITAMAIATAAVASPPHSAEA